LGRPIVLLPDRQCIADSRFSVCGLLDAPHLDSRKASTVISAMEDRYGHRISYLRVSITDRCNERCTYCMPQELQEWLPRHDILTFAETLRLIRVASELGVTKIRLTGGEPLTRRNVIQLFRQLPGLTNLRDIGLSTNGTPS
jgi:cyclic pyranopterin phosphate synthase